MTLDRIAFGDGRPPKEQSVDASPQLEALQATCRRQRRVIDTLNQAVRTLQDNGRALKAENAELRAEARDRQVRRSRRPPRGNPLDGDETLNAEFALEARACSDARSTVADWLSDAVTAPVLDHCKLIVTELMTNSVRHSGMPANEQVTARVELSADSIRIEVEDPGCGGSIALGPPDLQMGRGFGLNLVQALSDRWGVERSAKGPTRVWAQVARAPSTVVAEVRLAR